MIPVAETIQEAINHFLVSKGLICCTRKREQLNCSSLKEAVDFFNSPKPKKVRNKVRPIKTK